MKRYFKITLAIILLFSSSLLLAVFYVNDSSLGDFLSKQEPEFGWEVKAAFYCGAVDDYFQIEVKIKNTGWNNLTFVSISLEGLHGFFYANKTKHSDHDLSIPGTLISEQTSSVWFGSNYSTNSINEESAFKITFQLNQAPDIIISEKSSVYFLYAYRVDW